MGGLIIIGRVGGQLAITRSIGDHALRRDGVICNPMIKRHVIRHTDRWLIMATDGVWDSLNEKDVGEIIGHKEETAQKIAKQIVKMAIERGSKDNITCLAIKL